MLRLTKTLVFRRLCPRRWWRGSVAMVVYAGQTISEFGRWEFGEVGTAECTACGHRHLILGGSRGIVP